MSSCETQKLSAIFAPEILTSQLLDLIRQKKKKIKLYKKQFVLLFCIILRANQIKDENS